MATIQVRIDDQTKEAAAPPTTFTFLSAYIPREKN